MNLYYYDYMYKMSVSDLQGYLGEDIYDMIVEWYPMGDTDITKERLVKMINSIYGTSIFENRNFRKDMLLTLDKNSIYDIRDQCLKGKEGKEKDPYTIVEIVSKKPWNKSAISAYLLKLWGLPESVLDKESLQLEQYQELNAGERFYELLDYQYYIKQRALNVLNSGNMQERMLIHMPTGTGKTKTSMHIITNYIEFSLEKKGLIIWVAHTTELLQQAYDTFVEVWRNLGDGPIRAYRIWGDSTVDIDNDNMDGIAFCGLSKLMSMKESSPDVFEKLHRNCRLLVFDEAHKAAARQTRDTIEALMRMPKGYENRALLGLSATPGRTTQLSVDNSLLSNMFGNKMIHIDSNILNQINYGSLGALNRVAETNIIKYFQKRKILAKMSIDRLSYEQEFSDAELKILQSELIDFGFTEKDYSKEQLNVLARNKSRNRAIMIKLRNLYQNGIPTIVFACSVNHAKMLSAMLTLEEIPNSLITGDMNPVDRKNAIESFKDRESKVDIIINYEVLTTGFDSKNIRCVFITRPTKSIVLYSQMLGRGLRGPMMGGNEKCTLVDIDDNLEAFDNETAFSYFDDYWK